MKYIVDRFEGEYVLCEAEDMKIIKFERSKMPAGIKEGDVIEIKDDSVVIDKNETRKRKKNIEKLAEDLWS